MDGHLHDSVIFEILYEDLKWRWIGRHQATPELAYRTGYGEQEEMYDYYSYWEDKEFVN